MSTPRSSTNASGSPTFLSGLAAQLRGMRIGSNPLPNLVPQNSSPDATASDCLRLPVGPPMPPMPPMPRSDAPNSPPRSRPPHIADRPNPYDMPVLAMPQPQIPRFPSPPFPLWPLPNPWEQQPPTLLHAHSDPPPSLRPGYATPPTFPKPSPKISSPPNGLLSSENARNQSKMFKFPRHSGPPAPESVDRHIAPSSPTRTRAPSAPPSLTSPRRSDGAVQCSGMTQAGKQCSRFVKTPHPFILATHAEDGDVARFCHQHMDQILRPTQMYSRFKEAALIEFDVWIPSYLSPETKAALRSEMDKEPSAKDVPGYIYCYEIKDPLAPNQIHLKVGRTAKLAKRLDEWGKQCGKEVVPRGFWPGTIDGASLSLLRGQIQAGEKGKYSHKLERLIHLELSDLAIHEAYLSPEFLKSSVESPRKQPAAKQPVRSKCAVCGTTHKEIFTFTRVPSGPLKGREWDRIVRPVIEKWGNFVEEKL